MKRPNQALTIYRQVFIVASSQVLVIELLAVEFYISFGPFRWGNGSNGHLMNQRSWVHSPITLILINPGPTILTGSLCTLT